MVENTENERIIGQLTEYVAGSIDRDLPADVVVKAKHHILDTLAAMVSGSRLGPGEIAIKYIRTLGGTEESLVIGTDFHTSAINAGIANGMMAHADETDDSHLKARAHIGCSVVPAALAMAEKMGSSGTAFLRAVVLGYDIGARFNLSLNLGAISEYALCTHSHGPAFGAAAAAASLANASATDMINVLSFAVEQVSGHKTYMRDQDHISKAFVFGGMPARNGLTAATMVAAGFTGVPDDVTGRDGYLDAFSDDPRPGLLIDELGSRFEISDTNIKKWSVGSPIQAALDSLEVLMNDHGIGAADIAAVTARLPDDRAYIVDDREMPDINLQHLISTMLIDGGLTFASIHNEDRMKDPEVIALKKKITLVPEAFLTEARPERQAIIEITLNDGRKLDHRTVAVRGTPENPMQGEEVESKATGLVEPIIGAERTAGLIKSINDIESVGDMRDLRAYLTVS